MDLRVPPLPVEPDAAVRHPRRAATGATARPHPFSDGAFPAGEQESGRGTGRVRCRDAGRLAPRQRPRGADAAYAAQGAFTEALLEAGRSALRRLEQSGEPALVLVGRTYNIYDRSINCDIPRKLRALYGANVMPMDFLPLDDERHPGREPQHVLELGAADPGGGAHHPALSQPAPGLHLELQVRAGFLHQVVHERSRPASPALVLQFDGHSNDAGFITRCEAYLDSKGFLRCAPSATTT